MDFEGKMMLDKCRQVYKQLTAQQEKNNLLEKQSQDLYKRLMKSNEQILEYYESHKELEVITILLKYWIGINLIIAIIKLKTSKFCAISIKSIRILWEWNKYWLINRWGSFCLRGNYKSLFKQTPGRTKLEKINE